MRSYKYYEILQIDKSATQDQIQIAYLKLAKKLHPDINPSNEAHIRFKKVNEAYQVLRDPTNRSNYDKCPAECPICGTHEVVQTSPTNWRCRHDGCKFNPALPSSIIERIEEATISERTKQAVKLFESTQCSWCKKFFTNEPFLCTSGILHSNCSMFERLNERDRPSLLNDEKWWWRISDMIWQVQETGIMGRCRHQDCGALNPNPRKITCWKCQGSTLCCPECRGLVLIYNINKDSWKCPSAGHGGWYPFMPKIQLNQQSSKVENKQQFPKETVQKSNFHTENNIKTRDLPKWVMALLFVFVFSIVGTGISLFAGSFIPLWILFGFSAIFATEKWLNYYLRKQPYVGKLYRLILNLIILILIGVLIWSGIQLFSSQFTNSALIGSLIFIAELIFFIWIWKVIATNRLRWPSMKLTCFCLTGLFFIFAFAGVQPVTAYKDTLFSYARSFSDSLSQKSSSSTATVNQAPRATTQSLSQPVSLKVEWLSKNQYLGEYLIKLTPDNSFNGTITFTINIVAYNNSAGPWTAASQKVTFTRMESKDITFKVSPGVPMEYLRIEWVRS